MMSEDPFQGISRGWIPETNHGVLVIEQEFSQRPASSVFPIRL
jgi:hypothetical protein